jgi:hypothetical protein
MNNTMESAPGSDIDTLPISWSTRYVYTAMANPAMIDLSDTSVEIDRLSRGLPLFLKQRRQEFNKKPLIKRKQVVKKKKKPLAKKPIYNKEDTEVSSQDKQTMGECIP